MKPFEWLQQLSRRERQIMEILFERGRATAAEIHRSLPRGPSYSAVRALLRILEEKGYVRHEQSGVRYVYKPATPRWQARRAALRHLIRTFFGGSPEQAVAALLRDSNLSAGELDRLARLLEEAKEKGDRSS